MYPVFPHPVYVIPRSGKRSDLSEQAIQEQNMTNSRIRKCGPMLNMVNKYFESKFGPKVNFKDLKLIADQIVKKIPLHVDRISKRNKVAMQCWFVEHWVIVKPLIDNMVFKVVEPPKVQQSQIDETTSEEEEPKVSVLPFEVPTKSSGFFSSFNPQLI